MRPPQVKYQYRLCRVVGAEENANNLTAIQLYPHWVRRNGFSSVGIYKRMKDGKSQSWGNSTGWWRPWDAAESQFILPNVQINHQVQSRRNNSLTCVEISCNVKENETKIPGSAQSCNGFLPAPHGVLPPCGVEMQSAVHVWSSYKQTYTLTNT